MQEFTPTESDILIGLLILGDSLPVTIADWSGAHPRSVSRRLPQLVDSGLVVEKDRSVYCLTPSGYSAARGLLRERAEVTKD